MKTRLGMIALAIATVSCGAGGSSDGTSPPQPSEGGSVAGGSYDSVDAMQKDVEAAFYLCNAPIEIYDPPTSDNALAQADCSMDVSFFIYEPADVQASAEAIQANADGKSVLLVGDNWIISCSDDEASCKRIQGQTGGELVVSTP